MVGHHWTVSHADPLGSRSPLWPSQHALSTASGEVGSSCDLPRLRGLLHHSSNLLHQHLRWRVFSVHLPVRLRDLSSLGDEHTEVWSHSRVDKADVRADRRNLFNHRRIEQERGGLLFGCEDDAVGGCKSAQVVAGILHQQRYRIKATRSLRRADDLGHGTYL